MASKVELDPKTGGIKGDTSEEVYQLEQVEFSEDESDDGFEWTKPNLGMAEFPKGSGNKNNNLLENDGMTTGIYLDVRPHPKLVADASAVFYERRCC